MILRSTSSPQVSPAIDLPSKFRTFHSFRDWWESNACFVVSRVKQFRVPLLCLIIYTYTFLVHIVPYDSIPVLLLYGFEPTLLSQQSGMLLAVRIELCITTRRTRATREWFSRNTVRKEAWSRPVRSLHFNQIRKEKEERKTDVTFVSCIEWACKTICIRISWLSTPRVEYRWIKYLPFNELPEFRLGSNNRKTMPAVSTSPRCFASFPPSYFHRRNTPVAFNEQTRKRSVTLFSCITGRAF